MAVDFVVARVVRHFPRIAVALVAAVAVATSSCGGGGGDGGITGTSVGNVASVTIAPTSVQVDVGGSATLQAQALDGSGHVLSNRAFVWSTSDSTIARVSADGRLTGIAAGTAEVAANVEGKFAKATVTVGPRAVATVQLAPDAPRLVVGGRQQLTARTLYSDGTELTGRPITWASSDALVATVDTLGMLTAMGPGVTTITATSEGRSASVAVTVTAVPVASVAVAPAVDTLVVGQSTQLGATARDAGGAALAGRTVAWSSSNAAIASVSSSGLVLAAAPGTVDIVATVDGTTGQGRIVVLPRPVGAVIVSPSTSRLGVGETVQLSAQVTDANGTLLAGRDVVYSSSDEGIATVSAGGVVTAVAAGTATITASSEGKTGTADVVVALAPIASIDVQPANPTIFVGDQMQLQTTLRDAAGNLLTGRAVTWTTGAPAVVAVSTTGRLTALSPGTAVVVASAEGKVATVTVTVKTVPVASIRIAPAGGTIVVGGTLDLVATALDAAGNPLSGRTITFSSTNEQVAVVSSTGHVLALAPGTAQIVATTEAVQARVTVTVTAIPVVSVSISGVPGSLTPGGTAQLSAVARDAQGNVLTGRPVTWSTNNANVATISSAGVLTAVGAGSATITATVEGVNGTASVTVSAAPIATVTVGLNPASITVGQTSQATATAHDAQGNVLTGRAVTWSTNNANVATVSSTGVITGVGVGTASITATAEGKTSSATVTVTAAPPGAPATIAVTLQAASLTAGQTTQATAVVRDASGTIIPNATVTWSSGNNAVATVSGSGVVTAVAAGTAAIQATSGSATGTATLTVSAVPIASVSVTLGSASLTIGSTTQATAVAHDAQNNVLTGRAVTWSTNNANVATVSSTGVVTAVGAGTASITATSEGKSGAATVTVTTVPVATVAVTLGTSPITVGATTQATAVARDAQGNVLTGRTVAWSTNNANVATVSSTGVVTGVGTGTATITATSEGKTGSATIVVNAAPPVPVATVSVTLGASSIVVGATTQATAVARDAQGNVLTGRAVTWSTNDANVATVSSTGVVTGVGAGTASITATSEGKTGSATITVTLAPVASVTVALANPSIVVGATTQATATLRDASGNVLTGRAVAWSTNNANVATVSATGVVTAVGTGSASITATSAGVAGSATLTANAPSVSTVTVTLGTASLTTGQTTQATAVARDANGTVITGLAVTWASLNTAVATVWPAGVVTAVGAGTASIQATAGGRTGAATVTVAAPPPAPVATVGVTLGTASLVVGGTTQATAVTRDASGNVLTGRTVTWSTSNANVATVSTTGVVTAVGAGSASIIATSETKTGSATVTVTVAPVATVAVALGSSALTTGQTTQATATLRDAQGNVLTGRTIAWSTSNANVATVSSTGVVTAVGAGSATITATSETKSGSASLSVTAPIAPVATVSVSLGSGSLTVGGTTQASATLRDAQGNVLTGRAVAWSTSNANVATVSATGVVTAVGNGSATITATSEGKSGAANVGVTPRPAVRVDVVPSTYNLDLSSKTSMTATATAYDAAGLVIANAPFQWGTSDPAIAVVSGSGSTATVTGLKAGNATLFVSSGSVTATANIRVKD